MMIALMLMHLLTTPTAGVASALTAANKKDIEHAVKDKLKDPDSAHFRWPQPRSFGLYCGWVNAKNSYGGYTGFAPYMVIGGAGRSGRFSVFSVRLGSSGDDLEIVTKMCGDNGFDMSGPPPSD